MLAKDVFGERRFSADKMAKVNLFESPNLFCDVYGLEPGQSQKPHAHAGADKIYHVLEGRGMFLIGGERQEHGAGTCVIAPSGVDHGVENPGPRRLTLLVVMAPNPNQKKG